MSHFSVARQNKNVVKSAGCKYGVSPLGCATHGWFLLLLIDLVRDAKLKRKLDLKSLMTDCKSY